jgi:hypothetical protein
MENFFHFFPLWKRGMKRDLTAFQKAKLLQFLWFLPIGIYLGFGFWDLGFNMFMGPILDKS